MPAYFSLDKFRRIIGGDYRQGQAECEELMEQATRFALASDPKLTRLLRQQKWDEALDLSLQRHRVLEGLIALATRGK